MVEFETADPSLRGEMTIRFRLTDARGGTQVEATHERLPPGLSPADNEAGWRMSLGKLAALSKRTVPEPSPFRLYPRCSCVPWCSVLSW